MPCGRLLRSEQAVWVLDVEDARVEVHLIDARKPVGHWTSRGCDYALRQTAARRTCLRDRKRDRCAPDACCAEHHRPNRTCAVQTSAHRTSFRLQTHSCDPRLAPGPTTVGEIGPRKRQAERRALEIVS